MAQTEETPTPTEIILPTDLPTDAPTPTETPTTVPTDTPTEIPTATPTETPVPTATETESVPLESPTVEATLTATDEPIVLPTATFTTEALPTEPALGILYSDNFDSGDLSRWVLGAGWSLVSRDSGQALQIGNEPAQFVNSDLFNAATQAAFLLDNGVAQLTLRQSGVGSYAVTLDAAGQVQLYRAGALFQTAIAVPSTAGQWRTLRLSALGDIVRVAVDGVEVIAIRDTATLPPGAVTFSARQGMVATDDFAVSVPLDNLPTQTPAPLPTATTSQEISQAGGNFMALDAGSPLVVTSTNDADDGVCDTAHCSLREAINAANANAGARIPSHSILRAQCPTRLRLLPLCRPSPMR